MPSSQQQSQLPIRIKLLDNRLANQIAAGEVVERPASVVKELLENAIDAGASRIELDVERGGTRLIRVTDNGVGIVKEDLGLALSRHATSKISETKDLSAIRTLGFRGEALASISSVSKLTLTSRTKESEFAWQAIAEGRDMQVEILPAAATVGTRIEVRDLFFNTPARQKFLKAEKTEFNHIEEIFKRHALANENIAFILKHNNKVIKRVPATHKGNNYRKRIETICGAPFANCAYEFNCEHEQLVIKGWLGGAEFHRSESDIQYVFINDRPVKDKMLNHAIRQAYHGLLPQGRQPSYVIFLNVDLNKIDVNVHPTKHEVRFDEARMVHDLLVRSINEVVVDTASQDIVRADRNDDADLPEFTDEIANDVKLTSYHPPSSSVRTSQFGVGYSQVSYDVASKDDVQQNRFENLNKIRLNEFLWIVLVDEGAYLLNERILLFDFLDKLLSKEIKKRELESISKALLFPLEIDIELRLLEEVSSLSIMESLGFVFEPKGTDSILMQRIPIWLVDFESDFIGEKFECWVNIFTQGNLDNQNSKYYRFYQSLGVLTGSFIDGLMGQKNINELGLCVSPILSTDLQDLSDKRWPS